MDDFLRKEFYKKPDFYFFIVPGIALVWVLTISLLSLPTAGSKYDRREENWSSMKPYIINILRLDPERLNYKDQESLSADFDYANTVQYFTETSDILSSSYSLKSDRILSRGGRKTKGANLTIKSVGIENFTLFLSKMMLRWPDLQCDNIKLTKLKDSPDSWQVVLRFTYNY